MYRALYRKYRPQGFDAVVEQDSIKTILLNQMQTDNLKHAYLFCGPRGTGKTSIAKIFAKMINCEHEENIVLQGTGGIGKSTAIEYLYLCSWRCMV